jgi:hypothetical protein
MKQCCKQLSELQSHLNGLRETLELVHAKRIMPVHSEFACVSPNSTLESQIAESKLEMSEERIKSVYQKYAQEPKGVSQEDFFDACQEVRYDLTSRDETDNLFNNMDMNCDSYLDSCEFGQALAAPSSAEQYFSQNIPTAKLVLSAIPRKRGISPLEVFMNLSKYEIASVVRALAVVMEKLLTEKAVELKQSYAAANEKRGSSSSNEKFAQYLAGTIAEYHQGLSGRVGELSKLGQFLSL